MLTHHIPNKTTYEISNEMNQEDNPFYISGIFLPMSQINCWRPNGDYYNL